MENKYKNKKVLILGLGVNQGVKVKITDLKTEKELKSSLDLLKEFKDIEYTLGEHKFEDIDWADLVIKNPAIKPDNQYVEYAIKKEKQVEMDMGIFLEFINPSQVVGITGKR